MLRDSCLSSYVTHSPVACKQGTLLELLYDTSACCLGTGHSLGGALATLAAYDIRKQLQASGKQDVEVMCYSFGAPRTGNHAFAADYNHVVPDTWSVINEQACSGWLLHGFLPLSMCPVSVCLCVSVRLRLDKTGMLSPHLYLWLYGNNADASINAACF